MEEPQIPDAIRDNLITLFRDKTYPAFTEARLQEVYAANGKAFDGDYALSVKLKDEQLDPNFNTKIRKNLASVEEAVNEANALFLASFNQEPTTLDSLRNAINTQRRNAYAALLPGKDPLDSVRETDANVARKVDWSGIGSVTFQIDKDNQIVQPARAVYFNAVMAMQKLIQNIQSRMSDASDDTQASLNNLAKIENQLDQVKQDFDALITEIDGWSTPISQEQREKKRIEVPERLAAIRRVVTVARNQVTVYENARNTNVRTAAKKLAAKADATLADAQDQMPRMQELTSKEKRALELLERNTKKIEEDFERLKAMYADVITVSTNADTTSEQAGEARQSLQNVSLTYRQMLSDIKKTENGIRSTIAEEYLVWETTVQPTLNRYVEIKKEAQTVEETWDTVDKKLLAIQARESLRNQFAQTLQRLTEDLSQLADLTQQLSTISNESDLRGLQAMAETIVDNIKQPYENTIAALPNFNFSPTETDEKREELGNLYAAILARAQVIRNWKLPDASDSAQFRTRLETLVEQISELKSAVKEAINKHANVTASVLLADVKEQRTALTNHTKQESDWTQETVTRNTLLVSNLQQSWNLEKQWIQKFEALDGRLNAASQDLQLLEAFFEDWSKESGASSGKRRWRRERRDECRALLGEVENMLAGPYVRADYDNKTERTRAIEERIQELINNINRDKPGSFQRGTVSDQGQDLGPPPSASFPDLGQDQDQDLGPPPSPLFPDQDQDQGQDLGQDPGPPPSPLFPDLGQDQEPEQGSEPDSVVEPEQDQPFNLPQPAPDVPRQRRVAVTFNQRVYYENLHTRGKEQISLDLELPRKAFRALPGTQEIVVYLDGSEVERTVIPLDRWNYRVLKHTTNQRESVWTISVHYRIYTVQQAQTAEQVYNHAEPVTIVVHLLPLVYSERSKTWIPVWKHNSLQQRYNSHPVRWEHSLQRRRALADTRHASYHFERDEFTATGLVRFLNRARNGAPPLQEPRSGNPLEVELFLTECLQRLESLKAQTQVQLSLANDAAPLAFLYPRLPSEYRPLPQQQRLRAIQHFQNVARDLSVAYKEYVQQQRWRESQESARFYTLPGSKALERPVFLNGLMARQLIQYERAQNDMMQRTTHRDVFLGSENSDPVYGMLPDPAWIRLQRASFLQPSQLIDEEHYIDMMDFYEWYRVSTSTDPADRELKKLATKIYENGRFVLVRNLEFMEGSRRMLLDERQTQNREDLAYTVRTLVDSVSKHRPSLDFTEAWLAFKRARNTVREYRASNAYIAGSIDATNRFATQTFRLIFRQHKIKHDVKQFNKLFAVVAVADIQGTQDIRSTIASLTTVLEERAEPEVTASFAEELETMIRFAVQQVHYQRHVADALPSLERHIASLNSYLFDVM